MSWIADLPEASLPAILAEPLTALGLELQAEFCNERQLYAEDPSSARLPAAARVKLLVTRSAHGSGECHVEVRSAEPMLRSQTRCQQLAERIRGLMPASAAG